MLHVFAWSSITITIEMPDFDCLHRRFQTRLCHLLCRAPPNAGCAATSNPLQWLSPVLPQPNACCRKAGGYSARPAARSGAASHQQWLVHCTATASSLSFCPEHHCPATTLRRDHSESAADALCCLPPARHRWRGLEIQPDLLSFASAFVAWHIAWHIVCCNITPFCWGATSHMCYIAGYHITPFVVYSRVLYHICAI